MESSLLIKEDEVEMKSTDLMTFCMQLLNQSQWKSRRCVLCGSNVEILFYDDIAREVGIDKKYLDVDAMIIYNTLYAFPRSSMISEIYTGGVLRIYTGNLDTEIIHTGYERLICEKDLKELRPSDFRLKSVVLMHGPALLGEPKTLILRNKYSLSDTEVDEVESNNFPVSHYDKVYAIHSPYWPVEATEWITRRRSHGFPSKSVIKQVVRYGCDFVQVSHNRVINDNEYRFSFSHAELLIIKSWPISQILVYSTLWVLNKRIASSNLCSYYFKTLMLWACEEKPTQFWNEDFLVQSVCELLIEMMKCLKTKFCVNYFIPGNNMMNHLIDTDLSYEIDALWRTSQLRQLISDIIDTCHEYEVQRANVRSQIASLARIKRAYVIYWRVNNDYDYYTDLFCQDLSTDLQNALYVEFSDIYRGLLFQQMSASCVNESDKHVYSLKSVNHLLLAVNLSESQERDVIDNCSVGFVRLVLTHFMFCGIEIFDVVSEDKVQLEPNTGLDMQQMSQVIDNRNTSLIWHRSMEMNEEIHTNLMIFKEWPGQCPTVNISWFVAKAYLANLYYTTQRNVSLIIKTCDEIIEVSKLSYMNQEFAEKIFPVVLSTQWTSIYDKEIQELLGFYSLCSYVFDASSRSVYLGVCPVQFALYLKLRTFNDQKYNVQEDNNDIIIKDYVLDYMKHAELKQGDKLVNSGLFALTMVIVKSIGATQNITVKFAPRIQG